VFYSVEPAAASCTVVKFILQPIVENAIAHGFGDLPGAHSIEISAFVRDGLLTVVVQDDGQGMSPEQVENLNRYINERAGDKLDRYKKSIGMRNVNMRIKLAYGDEYGISVSGAGGSGLRVEYRLPAKGRGELG
jgi:two-component system sensor histidine kinase YesM